MPTIDEAPDRLVTSVEPDRGTSTTADTAVAPREVAVAATQDPRHLLRVGNEFYPDASRRAGETGRCKVRVKVSADGRISDALLEQGTGFDRLDRACLDAVKGQRMIPATRNGTAVESRITVPISWKLTD